MSKYRIIKLPNKFCVQARKEGRRMFECYIGSIEEGKKQIEQLKAYDFAEVVYEE